MKCMDLGIRSGRWVQEQTGGGFLELIRLCLAVGCESKGAGHVDDLPPLRYLGIAGGRKSEQTIGGDWPVHIEPESQSPGSGHQPQGGLETPQGLSLSPEGEMEKAAFLGEELGCRRWRMTG